MANLDDALKSDIKILQLSGNMKLESLIEILDTKLEGHTFGASAMRTNTVVQTKQMKDLINSKI